MAESTPKPPKTIEECRADLRALGYTDEEIEVVHATLQGWVEQLLAKYFPDIYDGDM